MAIGVIAHSTIDQPITTSIINAMDEVVLGGKKSWILRALPGAGAEKVLAWEMIESGRFMPRRIKGSFPGRELG